MLKNERKRLHCVSGRLSALRVILPPGLTENTAVPVNLLSNRYLKNTLRIDYKQRLPCFCRYYGANLENFLALS